MRPRTIATGEQRGTNFPTEIDQITIGPFDVMERKSQCIRAGLGTPHQRLGNGLRLPHRHSPMGFEPVRDRLRACHDQAAVAAASGFSSPMNSERSRRIASHRKSITARTFARLIISGWMIRSEEHTSELQSLMRISYAVFCLKKKKLLKKNKKNTL